jgi:hypothetical protein
MKIKPTKPSCSVLSLLGLGAIPALVLLSACTSAAFKPQTATAQTAAASRSDAAATPGEITRVHVSRVNGQSCQTAPVTFGQPFVPGDLSAGASLKAISHGQSLPIQTNVKARNADGSARHAVITLDAPCDGGPVALVKTTAPGQHASPLSLHDVLASSFDTRLSLHINGQPWQLDARRLLRRVQQAGGCKNAKIYCKRWLAGPLASEWVVGAPLQNAAGDKQSHLMAYFAVRAYGPAPVKRVRTDVVVENDWAYVPNPRNIKYDAQISVAGGPSKAFKDLTHYKHARWHHVVWWGANHAAPLYAALNPLYMQATPAVPSYQYVKISRHLLTHARQHCPPMKSCGITSHMEITGAQPQIGPLPRWSSAYVIDPAYSMFRWMLANSDAMGSYGIHYREQDTGNVLSLTRHPCATTLGPGRMKHCDKAPHAKNNFTRCHHHCHTPLHADEAHHPAPTYIAYLSTGDWYYATEMSFWADWILYVQNPKYRAFAKGLVYSNQLRGQAWGLRTLGDAAYLLPDNAPLKHYFNQVVATNIAWYNKHYTHNPKANKLGALASWHTVIYPSHGKLHRTGIATWQQSFFTWEAGNLADQGFAGANALRNWVSQFQVGLMTAPGYCWELASSYYVRIRDHRGSSNYYDTFAEVFNKSFPQFKGLNCNDHDAVNAAIIKDEGKKHFHYPPGSMVGYPYSDTGFPANFQIGLAAAAKSDLPNAVKAWNIFAHRNTQPSYAKSPQFAVVPTGLHAITAAHRQ